MWYKITGSDILEEKELAGADFPIISMYGRVRNINNKKHIYSLIRFSHDAQRMYDYWRSSEAERLAQSLKAPYVGFKGQFVNDPNWKHANNTAVNYLEADPVLIGGAPAPLPQQTPPPAPPIGYIAAAQSSNEDIKETVGLDNPMMNSTTGASVSQSAQVLSGKALDTLNASGELATYDFIDNRNKSVRQAFRVLVNLIPKVVDTERAERILGEDGKEDVITFNGAEGSNENGEIYDLSVGRYDVDVDIGADYTTKRKEDAESMMNFITTVPGAGEISGDLVAQTQDWKNADKFASRFKKQIAQINPTLLEGEDEDENDVEAQLQKIQVETAQKDQQLQDVTAQLDQALELIQTRRIDQEIAANKEEGALQRELIKSQTTLEKQNIDTEGEIKEETIKSQTDIITTLIANQQELSGQVDALKQIVITGNSQP